MRWAKRDFTLIPKTLEVSSKNVVFTAGIITLFKSNYTKNYIKVEKIQAMNEHAYTEIKHAYCGIVFGENLQTALLTSLTSKETYALGSVKLKNQITAYLNYYKNPLWITNVNRLEEYAAISHSFKDLPLNMIKDKSLQEVRKNFINEFQDSFEKTVKENPKLLSFEQRENTFIGAKIVANYFEIGNQKFKIQEATDVLREKSEALSQAEKLSLQNNTLLMSNWLGLIKPQTYHSKLLFYSNNITDKDINTIREGWKGSNVYESDIHHMIT